MLSTHFFFKTKANTYTILHLYNTGDPHILWKPAVEIAKKCVKLRLHLASLKMYRTHAHRKFQPKWIDTNITTCNGASQLAFCSRISATHALNFAVYLDRSLWKKNVHVWEKIGKRYILSPVLTPQGVRLSLMWIVNKHKLVQKDGKIKKHFLTFMLG